MENQLSKHLKYLLQKHACVILPGFGGFVTNYKSATIDAQTDFFSPPSLSVAFNQALIHNDGLLMQEFAKEEKSSLDDGEQKMYEKISELRSSLYKEGKVEINELGLLYLDGNYRIQFKPALKANLLPQSYGLHSFRFASIRNRNQNQFYEKEYMKGNRSKIQIGVIATAAAIVVFAAITMVVRNHIPDNPTTTQQAAILPIDTATPNTGIKANSVEKEATLEETSIQKTHALSYNETNNTTKYSIIAGSYTNQQSALKFVEQLEQEGFSPEIVADNGKHRVALYSYYDKYEALKQLDFVRQTRDKSVWLLKHKE